MCALKIERPAGNLKLREFHPLTLNFLELARPKAMSWLNWRCAEDFRAKFVDVRRVLSEVYPILRPVITLPANQLDDRRCPIDAQVLSHCIVDDRDHSKLSLL